MSASRTSLQADPTRKLLRNRAKLELPQLHPLAILEVRQFPVTSQTCPGHIRVTYGSRESSR